MRFLSFGAMHSNAYSEKAVLFQFHNSDSDFTFAESAEPEPFHLRVLFERLVHRSAQRARTLAVDYGHRAEFCHHRAVDIAVSYTHLSLSGGSTNSAAALPGGSMPASSAFCAVE